MTSISTTPDLDRLLAAGAPVAIGVSGGKDSQACALATVAHLDAIGHSGPRVLIHADLGSVEWDDSLPACEALAEHLGLQLIVVRRKAGGLMERWESRWASSVARYESLSTVTLVPCWSTPSMRFCTSETKTHPIIAELKRRFGRQQIVNVTGIRRAESAARSRATIADFDETNLLWTWRPIADWSVEQVFAAIDASGLAPHPAYREFGMSRVSCRFCIMSNVADLTAAAAQPEAHDLYRQMVALESRSSFAFQGSRWLGDVAPQLLTAERRYDLAAGKARAAARVAAEKAITRPMLYVRGWPTRMLTDDEADILAAVRAEVAALFGFARTFVDRAAVHGRYADLLQQRAGAQ